MPADRYFSRRRHTHLEDPARYVTSIGCVCFLSSDLYPVECCCVDNENLIADFMVDVVNVAAASSSSLLWVCPEDLGKAAKGWPASFWQWPSLREAVHASFARARASSQILCPVVAAGTYMGCPRTARPCWPTSCSFSVGRRCLPPATTLAHCQMHSSIWTYSQH